MVSAESSGSATEQPKPFGLTAGISRAADEDRCRTQTPQSTATALGRDPVIQTQAPGDTVHPSSGIEFQAQRSSQSHVVHDDAERWRPLHQVVENLALHALNLEPVA